MGIGPGLGRAEDTEAALLDQIDSCQTPMIVDADALNLLGEHRSYIGRLPKGSILTPHPKELERLVGKCQNSYERLTKARELAKSAGVYIILKGAYSVIIAPSGKCWFNPTGNPGMATGVAVMCLRVSYWPCWRKDTMRKLLHVWPLMSMDWREILLARSMEQWV